VQDSYPQPLSLHPHGVYSRRNVAVVHSRVIRSPSYAEPLPVRVALLIDGRNPRRTIAGDQTGEVRGSSWLILEVRSDSEELEMAVIIPVRLDVHGDAEASIECEVTPEVKRHIL